MKRVVIFQVGEQNYALDLVYSRGIDQPSFVMPIPQAPERIAGVINLRGMLFPVYSLRKRFGLPAVPNTPESRILLGETNGMLIAYEADKVLEIEEIDEDQIAPAPILVTNEETSYMDSIIFTKRGMAILLNLNGMLSKEEQKMLDEALAKMQKKKEEEAQAAETESSEAAASDGTEQEEKTE